jgi:hypothetical protein
MTFNSATKVALFLAERVKPTEYGQLILARKDAQANKTE